MKIRYLLSKIAGFFLDSLFAVCDILPIFASDIP